MRRSGTAGWWTRWRRDRRGASAVEFALVVPVLVAIYIGGLETAQGVGIYRKVTDTTVELANVTAQYTTMSATDVANVMNGSAQIMAPYPTSGLSIILAEITTDANSAAKVTWSQSYNGAVALTPGSTVTLPSGMASPSSNYIFVKTAYAYVPPITYGIAGSIPIGDQIYMRPRQSPSIPYTG
jgi:Flp pilus assembly protein TadG